MNPIAFEAKTSIWLKGLFTIYILKFQHCTKSSHLLKQHGSFQIAVFLQLAPFGSSKLTSILYFFLLRIIVSNCVIIESCKLELFCLVKIAEGTEVSFHFQIICLTRDQCCYFRTPQFGIYHAFWNTILGTALNPLNAHG